MSHEKHASRGQDNAIAAPNSSTWRTWLAPLLLLALFMMAGCAGRPASIPPGSSPPAAGVQPEAAENLRDLLARQLQVAPDAVAMISVEAVEWPDACLGAAGDEEICAQVVTPGYKITLAVDGQEYTYHTDSQASWARLVAGPEAVVGAPIIVWTGTADNGSCMQATIGAGGVAFSGCGGVELGGKFVASARVTVLAELAARYAAFSAVTDAGQIEFAGQGATVATPTEQLRIAAWAQKVAMEAAAGVAFGGLGWFGPAEPGNPDDTAKCASLQVGGEEAVLGGCDGLAQTVALSENNAQELTHLVDLLAPFYHETATETVVFDGMGIVESEAWQRAVAAWGRTRYAELSSGKVSAAGATVMSWDLGPRSDDEGTCKHLTVLGWGYAQAETRTCDGSQPIDVTGGWLTTGELEQLDQWLYARAALSADENYIAGVGAEPMSAEETVAAGELAATVWARLRDASEAQAARQPAGCPAAGMDTTLLVDAVNGYCLLSPSGYVVERTSPSETNLVSGSLMNHTAPRVAITVEDAAGRTLQAVGEQLLADYAPPGFAVEQSMTAVNGVDALLLDNLPGQDLNRRVAVVHEGRLYSFFFTPLGESAEARAAFETFYQGILDSFRFLGEDEQD